MWPFSSLSLFQRHRKERSGICEWCLCVALGGARPPPRTSARGERRREGAAARPARPFVTKSGGRKSVDPPNGRCDAASSGKARRRRRRPLVLAVRAGAPAHFLGESHRLKLSSSASPPPLFGGLRLPPPLASAGRRRRAQVWTPPAWEEKAVENGLARAEPNLDLYANN
uniref:Uncharacterized protein n=1 Tax=Ixodes ricinus TaxID=34613 RepID=A0A6B0UYH8_IXORI